MSEAKKPTIKNSCKLYSNIDIYFSLKQYLQSIEYINKIDQKLFFSVFRKRIKSYICIYDICILIIYYI